MSDTLLIHYSPSNPDQCVWSIVNDDGELTTKIETGTLNDAAALASNNKVIILLDSNFIHINQVRLPTKNKQKLLHAVPFALEEQLADEIEDLHFVIANNSKSDETAVACLRKDVLDEILANCHEAGIQASAVIPDSLCLTADDKQWAVLLFKESAYLHLKPLLSANIEREYYKDLLNYSLENEGEEEDKSTPQKIILFQDSEEECEQIEHKALDETEVINVSFNQHPLVIFCGNYKHAMPLNFLQQEYKPVNKGNAELKKWRLTAIMAGFWLVLHLANTAYQGSQLETSNQLLRAEIIKIYKNSFPKSKKIVNARVQMEQKLDDLRSGSGDGNVGLVSLIGAAQKAFSSNKAVTIKSINYRNNSMDISITSTNLKSIELINTQLNSDNLISEIVSSTSEKNIVKGNLRIKRPKS